MTLATRQPGAARPLEPTPLPQPHTGPLRTAARSAPGPATTGAHGLQRTPELRGASLPAAVRVALRAAHWIEEVDAGRRPASHLRTLLTPGLAARWSLDERRPRPVGRFRTLGPVQLQRRAARPTCHLVLLFDHRGRVLPTAMELRVDHGSWSVSAVERPGQPQVSALPAGWNEVLSPPVCEAVVAS